MLYLGKLTMHNPIYQFQDKYDTKFSSDDKNQAIHALESGQVLLLPHCAFSVAQNEAFLLSPNTLAKNAKNVSYNTMNQKISGSDYQTEQRDILTHFMARYAKYAQDLIGNLLPHYKQHLTIGRTSFRPAEVKNRKTSYRKDDSRLHVDAFVSTPVQGLRILRVFCNINPEHMPRVWHLGEPFNDVAKRFLPSAQSYCSAKAKLLHKCKLTKSLRSAYDHYMLQLHDIMKKDTHYQNTVEKLRFEFQPNSTWIVFTDQASHAALSGQYLLEQTFYLPVEALQMPEKSPLRILETMTNMCLTTKA
tara:strand:+ start:25 stop:936 length:912 start_codon:yes stop_codon:yes gene_type:complete